MKVMKLSLMAMAVTCLLACLPSAAWARSSFHFGLGFHGSSFGHHGHRSHYRGYGGHYGWLDRGYYHWLDGGRYRGHYGWGWGHHYRRRPYCGSVGIWVDDYWPDVVVERPTVITRERVVVKRPAKDYGPKYDDKTLKLYKDLRAQKSELLKRLQIGDKQQRKQAISDLAGFSFDGKVKKALEEILLSDPDAELRIEAAEAFARVKNRDALAVLEKVRVDDLEQQVREAADRAIKEIEGP